MKQASLQRERNQDWAIKKIQLWTKCWREGQLGWSVVAWSCAVAGLGPV